MARFARLRGVAERGLDLVDFTRFRGGGKLHGFCLHLLCKVVELGLLGPDFWLGLGVAALVSARTKTRKRQLAHHDNNVSIFLRGCCIKRRFSVGHGTDATEVLTHYKEGTLAVLDSVIRLLELGCSRGRVGQGGEGQGQGGKDFHAGIFRCSIEIRTREYGLRNFVAVMRRQFQTVSLLFSAVQGLRKQAALVELSTSCFDSVFGTFPPVCFTGR